MKTWVGGEDSRLYTKDDIFAIIAWCMLSHCGCDLHVVWVRSMTAWFEPGIGQGLNKRLGASKNEWVIRPSVVRFFTDKTGRNGDFKQQQTLVNPLAGGRLIGVP